MRLFESRVFIINYLHSNYRLAEACLVYNLKTLDIVYFGFYASIVYRIPWKHIVTWRFAVGNYVVSLGFYRHIETS